MNSMLLRLSVRGKTKNGSPMPHSAYGTQLNPFGIHGVTGEGKATILYKEIKGFYVDGSTYSLRHPVYRFSDMAFGVLDKETMFSPRVAPAVHGLGLLEAILWHGGEAESSKQAFRKMIKKDREAIIKFLQSL